MILPPQLWEAWLTTPSLDALKPAPNDLLHAWQVARFGINAHGPDLLRPVVPAPTDQGYTGRLAFE